MVSTSSLWKRRAIVISTFKTLCKPQDVIKCCSKDVIQSVQIVNTLNIKTVQESKYPKAIHSYDIQAY